MRSSRREIGRAVLTLFGPTNVHRLWCEAQAKALWNINPDDLKGKMPPFLPDVPEVREDLADYFGEIQAWDSALGLLLARLEAIGDLTNTMIVVSGDHGAPGFLTESAICTTLDRAFRSRVRWGGAKGGRMSMIS